MIARIIVVLVLALASLAGCATGPKGGDASAATYKDEVAAGLEEIYIVRTVRSQYLAGATAVCSAASPTSVSEQHYQLWSMRLDANNARIVDSHERPVGEFMACFSAPNALGVFTLYTRGTIGSISYGGSGECMFMKSKPPAARLLVLNCNGDLTDLPGDYIGGYLTTSSLAPSGGKQAEHVRGYLSTSVITMRLWRRPK